MLLLFHKYLPAPSWFKACWRRVSMSLKVNVSSERLEWYHKSGPVRIYNVFALLDPSPIDQLRDVIQISLAILDAWLATWIQSFGTNETQSVFTRLKYGFRFGKTLEAVTGQLLGSTHLFVKPWKHQPAALNYNHMVRTKGEGVLTTKREEVIVLQSYSHIK